MDLKIRDVDPATVAKIDELAKLRQVSRSFYLKKLLEDYTLQAELIEQKKQHEIEMKMLRNVVEQNVEVLTKLYELMDKE